MSYNPPTNITSCCCIINYKYLAKLLNCLCKPLINYKQVYLILKKLNGGFFSMAALEEEDDDDDDGEEFEGKKGLEVKAHQASHTNYLMMRGYCSPGIGRVYLLIG